MQPKVNNRLEIERELLDGRYNFGFNAKIRGLHNIIRYTPKIGNEGPFHVQN